ncbi:radical SAM protein [Pseudoalteromonas sp. SG41-1]|nr:radical SAM protein [Pseudoalteromonas sp. SG41-1]
MVIWFQGCALACQGCWNKAMWSFKENQLIHREQLLARILATPQIRGVTLLGGEPLHQADNVWWLFEQIKQRSKLTTFLFTGFEMSELKAFGFAERIENLCDIVAVGRYNDSLRNINQQWIGSDNQQVIFPNNSREQDDRVSLNQVELIIDDQGGITTLGFPSDELITSLN